MKQFTEDADEAEVTLRIGEVIEVCLNSNPTTGFRWRLDSSGEPACRLVREYFSERGRALGGGGIHHWQFEAVAHGTSIIELSYRRRWQKGPPARTFKLRVRAGA